MARDDKIEFEGTVVKLLPATKFEVEIKINGGKSKTLICTMSGRLRQHFIKIVQNDEVTVEVSPYDLTKGIITWRK